MYLLETGLVLVVAPWSTFWERNLLAEIAPLFGGVVRLGAVRGAVSGVGIVNLYAGFWELGIWLATIGRCGGVARCRPTDAERGAVSGGAQGAELRGEDTRSWTPGR